MANVVIDDSSLYAIGDALREKLGESHIEQVYVETIHHPETTKNMEPRIAKTSNATGFDSFSGSYANSLDDIQTIRIEGATNLLIDFAYQTESTSYDYLIINDSSKLGGTTLTKKSIVVRGDTVKFTFRSDNSNGNYLGYYAEVYGVDADGNILQEITPAWDEEIYEAVEVPHVYKPRDMAAAIESIETDDFDCKIVTWADGTDEQIVAMIEAADRGLINLSDYWKVGDKRNVTYTNYTIQMILLDNNPTNLALYPLCTPTRSGRTTGSFIVGFSTIISESLPEGYTSSNTSQQEWGNWIVYRYTNSSNLNGAKNLPSYVNALAKPVSVLCLGDMYRTDGTPYTIVDKWFLPTTGEVTGTHSIAKESVLGFAQYEYYTTAANLKKYSYSDSSSAKNWWTRSKVHSSSNCYFLSTTGALTKCSSSSNSSAGISLHFII